MVHGSLSGPALLVVALKVVLKVALNLRIGR